MTTYNYADVHDNKMFYREAGDKKFSLDCVPTTVSRPLPTCTAT